MPVLSFIVAIFQAFIDRLHTLVEIDRKSVV